MKGIFKDKNDLSKFVLPIQNIGIIAGENGINIILMKQDDTVKSIIAAKNSCSNTMLIHKWNDLFDDFEIDEDEIKIGLIHPQELTSKLSLFEDGKINIKLNDDGILSFKQGKIKLNFKTSDPEVINEAKRDFKGTGWIAKFEYTEELKPFTVALKKLNKNEFVFINGIEEKNELTLTIRNKIDNGTSFSYTLDAEINEDFEIPFRREYWPTILESDHESMNINISERFMNFSIKTDYSTTDYYIAKSVVK